LSSEAAREKLMRFFLAWLEIRDADDFTISTEVFPEFTPELAEAMVSETRNFLEQNLGAIAPSLADITQATASPLSQALLDVYGLDDVSPGVTVLNPSERLGIFTQPGFIASHSGPETTRLIKRGVFFTRKVMCLPLGMPPEGVDTSIPDIPGASERERIESVTSPPMCMGCHSSINPFGFMLESYDAIGRFRTMDEHGLAVDPTIAVDFLDEGPLTAESAVQALAGFTASHRFQQCFARQMFRFYMGRPEQPSDDPLLRQMFFHFANGGQQNIVTLLENLASSTRFSARTPAP
jgi:hypothetical protein